MVQKITERSKLKVGDLLSFELDGRSIVGRVKEVIETPVGKVKKVVVLFIGRDFYTSQEYLVHLHFAQIITENELIEKYNRLSLEFKATLKHYKGSMP